MANIKKSLSDLHKNKTISATVLEVVRGMVSVKIGERVLTGLRYIGGPLSVGQKVQVDYTSGTPIVQAKTNPAPQIPRYLNRPRVEIKDPDQKPSSLTSEKDLSGIDGWIHTLGWTTGILTSLVSAQSVSGLTYNFQTLDVTLTVPGYYEDIYPNIGFIQTMQFPMISNNLVRDLNYSDVNGSYAQKMFAVPQPFFFGQYVYFVKIVVNLSTYNQDYYFVRKNVQTGAMVQIPYWGWDQLEPIWETFYSVNYYSPDAGFIVTSLGQVYFITSTQDTPFPTHLLELDFTNLSYSDMGTIGTVNDYGNFGIGYWILPDNSIQFVYKRRSSEGSTNHYHRKFNTANNTWQTNYTMTPLGDIQPFIFAQMENKFAFKKAYTITSGAIVIFDATTGAYSEVAINSESSEDMSVIPGLYSRQENALYFAKNQRIRTLPYIWWKQMIYRIDLSTLSLSYTGYFSGVYDPPSAPTWDGYMLFQDKDYAYILTRDGSFIRLSDNITLSNVGNIIPNNDMPCPRIDDFGNFYLFCFADRIIYRVNINNGGWTAIYNTGIVGNLNVFETIRLYMLPGKLIFYAIKYDQDAYDYIFEKLITIE